MLSLNLNSFSFPGAYVPGVLVESGQRRPGLQLKREKALLLSLPSLSQGFCSPRQTALYLFQVFSLNMGIGTRV